MERILHNTILGAKPLKEDGSSFYYSDYNNRFANKGYHRDKWPCCSGTFPQITADYGISSYFHDSDGVYVNLYTPSRVSWKRDSARITLTQRTSYPYDLYSQIEITADKPVGFAVHLRIPGICAPSSGCAPMIWMSGFFSLKKREQPMMVPVVPMLLTKWVIRPCVSRQISGAVPS